MTQSDAEDVDFVINAVESDVSINSNVKKAANKQHVTV